MPSLMPDDHVATNIGEDVIGITGRCEQRRRSTAWVRLPHEPVPFPKTNRAALGRGQECPRHTRAALRASVF